MAVEKLNSVSEWSAVNSVLAADIVNIGGIEYSVGGGGTEDLTTYTEVDPSSDLTVTSNLIAFDTMRRDVAAGVYKDFGVSYFTGDFEFTFDFDFTAEVGTYGSATFALSMTYSLTRDARDVSNQGIDFYIGVNGGADLMFFLRDWQNNASDSTSSGAYTVPDKFWITMARVGTTVTLDIHTDESRTTLYDTLTIAQSSAHAYRYLYPTTSFGSSFSPADTLTGSFANLIIS